MPLPALLALAALTGALLAWLALRARPALLQARLDDQARQHDGLARELDAARQQVVALRGERDALAATLDAERRAQGDLLRAQAQSTQQLREAFAALSQDALHRTSEQLLALAQERFAALQQQAQGDLSARQAAIEQLVQPVSDGLQRVDERLQAFDRERATSAATVQEHLRQVAEAQGLLSRETRHLVQALRAPHVRGQWGEMQLRRVVELAGMDAQCDFVEQVTLPGDDGRLRPDLVVRLPGEKQVVVDAKAPLAAYLDAMEAADEAGRALHLDRHAQQVRAHVEALASKEYAARLPGAPDFVVLFLPGEAFFAAACQRDPALVDFAVRRGVIPASPTTLITLLKAAAYGWQQERIARGAEQIRAEGQQLHERVRLLASHLLRLRRALEGAVGAFNDTVGSLERRVLPSARRLRDLGAGAGEAIPYVEAVDDVPRLPVAPELAEPEPSP